MNHPTEIVVASMSPETVRPLLFSCEFQARQRIITTLSHLLPRTSCIISSFFGNIDRGKMENLEDFS